MAAHSALLIGDAELSKCLQLDFLFCLRNELCFLFLSLRATLAAYGGSEAKGGIGAVANGLRQSHSNAGSEPCLRPTPQLMATPGP